MNLSEPRKSPVDGDFLLHEFYDELVVGSLGEGVEEGFDQGFGLVVIKFFDVCVWTLREIIINDEF